MLPLATLALLLPAMLLRLVTALLTRHHHSPPLSHSGSGNGSPSVRLCSWARGHALPPPLCRLLLPLLPCLLLLLLHLLPLSLHQLLMLLHYSLLTCLEGGGLTHPRHGVVELQLLRRGAQEERE